MFQSFVHTIPCDLWANSGRQVSAYIYGDGRQRITNGVAEGLNSKIMSIKRKACGYSNKDHFKAASCFFRCGLDLYPR